MYKISVIVPIYNVAPYIVRCMDSLRAQTLSDIEVFFVDDKGADNSVSLIENYIADHTLSADWHVLHMPVNGGPGAARNMGLESATGEYIAFVDGDDWVEPKMFEDLYVAATDSDADMAACDALLHQDEDTRVLANPPYIDRAYYLSHYVAYLWTYLFKRSFLEKESLRFLPVRSSEDSCFLGQCILAANQISRIEKPLYHYVVYPDSISHRRHVWRGGDKKVAFDALLRFAAEHDMMTEYRWTLYWVYFKKVFLVALIDYIRL